MVLWILICLWFFFCIGLIEVYISCLVGIVFFFEYGLDSMVIICYVDIVMYIVKEGGWG